VVEPSTILVAGSTLYRLRLSQLSIGASNRLNLQLSPVTR
jgi:hypothetical protein